MGINDQLANKVKKKFPQSTIIAPGAAMDIINEHDTISLLSDIIKYYDSTGYLPKKPVQILGKQLNSDFLLLSKLKAEKMDLSFVGKGFGASLEILMIDVASNRIVVGGIAQFKQGGIFGTGGTDNKEAATELVQLASDKL